MSRLNKKVQIKQKYVLSSSYSSEHLGVIRLHNCTRTGGKVRGTGQYLFSQQMSSFPSTVDCTNCKTTRLEGKGAKIHFTLW